MIDSWAAERLTIFGVVRTEFPLVAGTQTYTIGSGGTFNVARPLWIPDAGIVVNTSTPPVEIRLDILSDQGWARIPIKDISSSVPTKLYYDYAYSATGLGSITLWPKPDISTPELALYLPTALTQLTGTVEVQLATTLAVPPGYGEALRLNLALRLSSEFGKPMDPLVAGMARESLARIERANKRELTLECDPALLQSPGTFNWRLG